MSLYIRILPNRLTSLFNPRKQIMQLDRRLTKHIKRSAIIQKYDRLKLGNLINEEFKQGFLLQKKVMTGINSNSVELYSTLSENPKKSYISQQEDKYLNDNKTEKYKQKPTEDQLEHVYKTLTSDLPNLFCASLDYRIYHKDLEFINNLKGTSTKGINNYIKQILFVRTMGHVMYAYVKFDVLKITMHPEDSTIKVRWRIRGLSGFKVFTLFWKFRLMKINDTLRELETWHDGFSTYYVGPDGLVFKHVAEKMMPDDETMPEKNKNSIAAKLAT